MSITAVDIEHVVRKHAGNEPEITTHTEEPGTIVVTLGVSGALSPGTMQSIQEELQNKSSAAVRVKVKQQNLGQIVDDFTVEPPESYGGDTGSFIGPQAEMKTDAMKKAIQNSEYAKKTYSGSLSFTVDADDTDTEIVEKLMERAMSRPKQGDRVIVENVNGDKVYGEVRQVRDETVEEHRIGNGQNLDEYWSERGVDIPPTDKVVSVNLEGNETGVYSYPESKVMKVSELTTIGGIGPTKAQLLRDAGYYSIESLKNASQTELADVQGIGNALAARIKADVGNLQADPNLTHVGYTCPTCDETFSKESETAIEDPEGDEVYCSLRCLNHA